MLYMYYIYMYMCMYLIMHPVNMIFYFLHFYFLMHYFSEKNPKFNNEKKNGFLLKVMAGHSLSYNIHKNKS